MPEKLHAQNAVAALLNAVPEFYERRNEWDSGLPYDVFGSFAQYLCEVLNDPSTSSELVHRCVGFLEQMARSNDDEVVNLLVVGALEVISDDPDCSKTLCSHADPQIAALVKEVDAFWGRTSSAGGEYSDPET